MADVTIYWYRSNTLLSRLIRLVTRSRYSHVNLALGGVVYEAVGDGLFAWRPPEAEVRIAQAIAARRLFIEAYDAQRVQAWLDEITDDERAKTYAVPGRYSVWAFLAAGIGPLVHRRFRAGFENEYICSGLVATALWRCYIDLPHEPSTMTPEDLADLLRPHAIERPS